MAQNIHLNGGPWHDQTVVIEDGRDHFHIIEPLDLSIAREITEPLPDEGPQLVRTREGMYSQIQACPGEFEWDGWRSHD